MKIAKYKFFFAISDLVILFFILIITSITINKILDIEIQNVNGNIWVMLLTIALLLLSLLIFSLNNLYKISLILVRSAHITAVIKSLFYLMIITIPTSFALFEIEFLKMLIIIFSFVLTFVLVSYTVRVELLRRIYSILKRKGFRKKIIIVGDGKPGKLLATKLAFENPIGINIIGFIDEQKNIGEEIINGKRVLGKYNDIQNVVKDFNVDELLIAYDTKDYEKLLCIIDYCSDAKINIKITSDLFKIIPQKVYTEKYANIPVIDVSNSYHNWLSIKSKRLFDLLIASLGFLFLTPILLTIGLLIKFNSKGPILFSQIRIGKDGKQFKFYKFRTMFLQKADDTDRKEKMLKFMKEDRHTGNSTKIISDSRITKVGRILRKTSIDELPQLLNVIKGDMSLVGPRPCLQYEFENYDNWQKRRLTVTPGCTGMWQVVGRSSVSFRDSIVLDLYYINNMSPWLDLQILIKTIPVMLFGTGGK
ncbi:MAG: sugar transferase [Bacteroidetes bacterium]|nr:sugar transferase [Bacteroidota bacterium]